MAPLQLLRSRACLTPIDSCGVRRQEGTNLHVPASDGTRGLVHVRRGTGATDRSVPLPPRTLEVLRQDWATHRHPVWILPAPGRGGIGMPTATAPMPRHRVQEAFRTALTHSGIKQRAAVHTLRPSSATPLLEAGVHLRLIQDSLGPTTPPTTALSTPLTATADAMARDALAGRMRDL